MVVAKNPKTCTSYNIETTKTKSQACWNLGEVDKQSSLCEAGSQVRRKYKMDMSFHLKDDVGCSSSGGGAARVRTTAADLRLLWQGNTGSGTNLLQTQLVNIEKLVLP